MNDGHRTFEARGGERDSVWHAVSRTVHRKTAEARSNDPMTFQFNGQRGTIVQSSEPLRR
jgi:hypothetical protein